MLQWQASLTASPALSPSPHPYPQFCNYKVTWPWHLQQRFTSISLIYLRTSCMHTMHFNRIFFFQFHPDPLRVPFPTLSSFLVHWCRVIRWNMRGLPGAIALKKTDSPSTVASIYFSTRDSVCEPSHPRWAADWFDRVNVLCTTTATVCRWAHGYNNAAC